MSTVKLTGRTRSVTYSASGSMSVGNLMTAYARAGCSLGVGWLQLVGYLDTGGGIDPDLDLGGGGGGGTVKGNLTMNLGAGSTLVTGVASSITWTLTITATLQTWATFDDPSGTGVYEATVFEQVAEGTNLVLTLTATGTSGLTRTISVGTGGGTPLDDVAVHEVFARAGVSALASASSSLTVSSYDTWTPVGSAVSGSYTLSGTSVTGSASVTGTAASASITTSGTLPTTEHTSQAIVAGKTDLTTEVDASVWRRSQPYPHNLTISLPAPTGTHYETMAGGAFSLNMVFRQYTSTAVIGVPGGSYYLQSNSGAGRPSWLSLGVLQSSLAAGGEGTDGFPAGATAALLLRGPRWTGCTLTDAGNVTIDDGSTLTPTGAWSGDWTGASGGTASIDSGAVKISGSSGKTLSRTFTGAGRMYSWPRLRLRIKSADAPHDLTVSIGTKTWTITTGTAGAFMDIDIDLGAEENGPDVSRWQTAYETGLLAPPRDYAGSQGTITISEMDAGDYWIDSLQLRGGSVDLHWLHMSQSGGSISAKGIDAGHTAVELFSRSPVFPLGFGSIKRINDFLTVDDYLSRWSLSGLTENASPTTLDEFLSASRPARCLWGGGYYWNGTWTPCFDDDATSPGPQMAQLLLSRIRYHSAWGGWPDPALPSASDGAVIAGALGGGYGVWGRVLDEAGRTPGSASLTAAGTDWVGGATSWSGSTDGDGAFESRASFAVNGRSGYLSGISGVAPLGYTFSFGRYRLVVVQKPPAELVRPLALDSSRRWLYLGDARRIRVVSGEDHSTLFVSPESVYTWEDLAYDERRGALYLVGRDGSSASVKVCRSHDRGARQEELLTVTTTAMVIAADSERQTLLIFYADSGTSDVKRRRSLDGGATWDAAVTCLIPRTAPLSPLNLNGLPLAIVDDPRRQGALYLTVATDSSTTKLYYSVDAGANWKEIPV